VPTCHTARPLASRAFIITSYSAPEGGAFLADLPLRCLASTELDGLICLVRVHHRRSRKTGPSHLLTVARCTTHQVVFTLYPPGYVPYGRIAMAPVDSESQVLDEFADVVSAGGAVDSETPRQIAWNATFFRAARDGRNGLAWPRDGSTDAFGSWRTQGRWIAISAALLGLTDGDADHWPLAGPLGLPALTLREASVDYASAKGYVARGRAVTLLLDALTGTGRRLLDLLLLAGCAAGRWGEALRWDPRAQVLRRIAQLARSP
jgi:hypothetical protein